MLSINGLPTPLIKLVPPPNKSNPALLNALTVWNTALKYAIGVLPRISINAGKTKAVPNSSKTKVTKISLRIKGITLGIAVAPVA